MIYLEYAIEKISRKINKCIIKHSSNPRPTSEPFISGDGFRFMAQHVYEKGNEDIDALKVHERDIVFVQSDMLLDFFYEIHPRIKNKYILITHNGDRNISESDIRLIDDKIIHWFAQNLLFEHPKMTPIPIGLENAHYYNAGRIDLYKKTSGEKNKNGRILVAFSVASNRKTRSRILEELKKNPLADILNERLTQKTYIQLLSKYSYVASPPGNGIDCHRTWEGLCVGTIPIVSSDYLSNYFKKLGVPLVPVNSWSSIGIDNNLPVIHAKVEHIEFDYWKNLIYKYKL